VRSGSPKIFLSQGTLESHNNKNKNKQRRITVSLWTFYIFSSSLRALGLIHRLNLIGFERGPCYKKKKVSLDNELSDNVSPDDVSLDWEEEISANDGIKITVKAADKINRFILK